MSSDADRATRIKQLREQVDHATGRVRFEIDSDLSGETVQRGRRLTVAASTILVVLVLELVPTKIVTFGLELGADDREWLVRFLAAAVVYLLAQFVVTAGRDWTRWRLRNVELTSTEVSPTEEVVNSDLSAEQVLQATKAESTLEEEVGRLQELPLGAAVFLRRIQAFLDAGIPCLLASAAIAMAVVAEIR